MAPRLLGRGGVKIFFLAWVALAMMLLAVSQFTHASTPAPAAARHAVRR